MNPSPCAGAVGMERKQGVALDFLKLTFRQWKQTSPRNNTLITGMWANPPRVFWRYQEIRPLIKCLSDDILSRIPSTQRCSSQRVNKGCKHRSTSIALPVHTSRENTFIRGISHLFTSMNAMTLKYGPQISYFHSHINARDLALEDHMFHLQNVS